MRVRHLGCGSCGRLHSWSHLDSAQADQPSCNRARSTPRSCILSHINLQDGNDPLGLYSGIGHTKVEMGGRGSGECKLRYPTPASSVQRREDTITLSRCLNWCDLANHTWLFCDPFWQAVSEALKDASITRVRCSKYTVSAAKLAKLRRET